MSVSIDDSGRVRVFPVDQFSQAEELEGKCNNFTASKTLGKNPIISLL